MSNTFFQAGQKNLKGLSPPAPPWLRAWAPRYLNRALIHVIWTPVLQTAPKEVVNLVVSSPSTMVKVI